MERGPLALFGAIIAVGLGPALWMGVQLGVAQQGDPVRPPAVGGQVPEPAQNLLGGAGAGDQTGGSTTVTDPRGNDRPSPSASVTDPSPSASHAPTRAATTPPTTRPTTAPTTEPATSAPPSESTSAPTTEPTDTTEPPAGDETDDPQDQPSEDDWWTYEDPDPHGDFGDYGNYASSRDR